MNVQDGAGLREDPTITAVVPRVTADTPAVAPGAPGTGGVPSAGQGQLFSDAYPTYADTDQIPAVSGRGPRSPRRTHRWLRAAVVIVAIAVLAAAAALGLVRSGVFKSGPGGGTGSTATGQHGSVPNPSAPVAAQTSVGNGTATYMLGYPIYTITVSTTTGRSWVSIGAFGQTPQFQGILEPNSSQKVVLLGPATVQVGAGGTHVTVAIGKRTSTLTPLSAPFTYQFEVPKKS